jgi:hypothetical protein
MKRTLAERIAGQLKPILGTIEDGEGKVADQTIEQIIRPLLEGFGEQFGIGEGAERRGRQSERLQKLLPIVQAHVRRQKKASAPDQQRLLVIPVLRQCSVERTAERDPVDSQYGPIIGSVTRLRI